MGTFPEDDTSQHQAAGISKYVHTVQGAKYALHLMVEFQYKKKIGKNC